MAKLDELNTNKDTLTELAEAAKTPKTAQPTKPAQPEPASVEPGDEATPEWQEIQNERLKLKREAKQALRKAIQDNDGKRPEPLVTVRNTKQETAVLKGRVTRNVYRYEGKPIQVAERDLNAFDYKSAGWVID